MTEKSLNFRSKARQSLISFLLGCCNIEASVDGIQVYTFLGLISEEPERLLRERHK